MRKFFVTLFVTSTNKASSILLDNPYLFNYVRFFLAGKQTRMKGFIKNGLKKYTCLSIADICCGTGDFAELISKRAKYTGWDLNDDFIQYAKKRYPREKNKQFIRTDILAKNYMTKDKFDAVLLISTLHHFSDKELSIILPHVKKITKKVIIIADIIPDPPHPIQKFFAKIDRGRYVRPAEEKIRILKKYFTIIYTEEIPTVSAVQLGILCIPK